MTLNAQIDALEHLLVALLVEGKKRQGIEPDWVFDRAEGSIMGSDGPGNPAHKTEAMAKLKDLKALLPK